MSKQEWISVKDRPLIHYPKSGGSYWEATEDGDKPFIAAIPEETNGVPGWWIHHCVLEDGTGLCVVGDTENEPAGYEIQDVTHWLPSPSLAPPNP